MAFNLGSGLRKALEGLGDQPTVGQVDLHDDQGNLLGLAVGERNLVTYTEAGGINYLPMVGLQVPPDEPPPPAPGAAQHFYSVDFSNWQGDFNPDILDCLYRDQARIFTVGVYPFQAEIARKQMLKVVNKGYALEVYGEPTTTTDGRFQNVIDICQRFPVRKFWIDVERHGGYEPSFEGIIEAIGVCKRAGVDFGIYTGDWTFEFDGQFVAYDLWFANYSGKPSTHPTVADAWRDFSFGGWPLERVKRWQYGWGDECGMTVDWNLDFEVL